MDEAVWVRRVLEEAGLVPPGGHLSAKVLSGGVSSEVVLVEAPASGGRFVVKRPFEWFRVVDPWHVPKRRARIEQKATRLFQTHLPDQVAPLLHFVDDPEDPVLVFHAAGAAWRPWKEHLLAGHADVAVARRIGRLLARLHALSNNLAKDTLRDDALFQAQRIEPYLNMAAHRVPEAAPMLDSLAERFFERDDLVHGDFTPKNLLVAPNGPGLWLIDHEVVTRGDAAFDLASLCNHLGVKSLHQPTHGHGYLACAQAATSAYLESDVGPRPDPVDLSRRSLLWLPALFLARMVGTSPVEYLDANTKAKGVRRALDWFHDPPHDLEGFWLSIPETK